MSSSPEAAVPEMPATETLGPLFKLTRVYLWDDDEDICSTYSQEPLTAATNFCRIVADANPVSETTGQMSVEDFELAQERESLGLPLSFGMTEKKSLPTKRKKKRRNAKSVSADNNVCGMEVNQSEIVVSAAVLHDETYAAASSEITEGNDEVNHHIAIKNNIVFDENSAVLHADILGKDDKKKASDEISYILINSYLEQELIPDDILGKDDKEQASVSKFLEKELLHDDILGKEDKEQASDEISDILLNNFVEKELIPDNIIGKDDKKQASDKISDTLMYNLLKKEQIPDVTKFERALDHLLITSGGSCCHKVTDAGVHGFCQEGKVVKIDGQNNYFEDSSCAPCLTVDTSDNPATSCSSTTESSLTYPQVEHAISDIPDTPVVCEYGEWRVVWDSFYKRNYFYNCHSQNSTWHPPLGFEHFAHSCNISKGNVIDENGGDACLENDSVGRCINQKLEEVSCEPSSVPTVHYKYEHSDEDVTLSKTANDQITSELSDAKDHAKETTSQGIVTGVPWDIVKYWNQRYSLFSRFDYGIKMDNEGWFSVTPESIARHHASRLTCGTIIDCFTGVGGNAIQFALTCNHVTAVDIDPHKVDCGRHNAAIYGVNDNIDFLIGDFFEVAAHLKADVVFLSPPWGGPAYNKVHTYDMRSMLKPRDGLDLFNAARMIASKVVMFLPRNVNINQLAELSLSVTPPWSLEVEKNFLNGKLKAITAYFERPNVI